MTICLLSYIAASLVNSTEPFLHSIHWEATVLVGFWFYFIFYTRNETSFAHQKLGHVKSQILDKAESMLSQRSHATQEGLVVLRGLWDTSADRTQGDQDHLAAVMSYKMI